MLEILSPLSRLLDLCDFLAFKMVMRHQFRQSGMDLDDDCDRRAQQPARSLQAMNTGMVPWKASRPTKR